MELWELAQSKRHIHRFSTIFTAEQVKRDFQTPAKIDEAIDWCKRTGVTRVYIESYRGVQVELPILANAHERFRAAGIDTAGCVTPIKVGKETTRWKPLISCYTDHPTQKRVIEIFEHAAKSADVIMIDDFWFTDCACPECNAAREAKTVDILGEKFPVAGDGWDDYRCELMVQLSRKCAIEPAKRVNPNCRLIIKYPQWYDRFHLRGYEVTRESADFDLTWAGTETRDYPGPFAGCMPQYEGYFVMRWLLGIAPEKCGGGWYDPYGTTEHTYVEQARQTILGGARESLLFAYGALQKDTGPRNVDALRANMAELFDVAEQVAKRQPAGLAAYKPANSQPIKEQWVYDFVGMLGIPLVPCHEFPSDAPGLLVTTHALKDPEITRKLSAYIAKVRPVLMTDALAERMPLSVDVAQHHVKTLDVRGNPAGLLQLTQEELDPLREALLAPLGWKLKGLGKIAFYPFTDGSWVLENFNDREIEVELNGTKQKLPARGWVSNWK